MSKKIKALLVEDNAVDVVPVRCLLNGLGIYTAVCFDGKAAIDVLNQFSVELVILDWNLPVLSGAEVLSHIETIVGKKPKVIIHSGEDLKMNHLYSRYNLELVDLWKKPLSPSEAARKIRRILEGGLN